MEIATFSKIFGKFILALVSALVPAAQPFFAPEQLCDAALPQGVFTRGSGFPSEDGLSIERRGPHRYRLQLSDDSAKLEFDATLFQLAGVPGGPAYFLDLEPRTARPERHGMPPEAKHLAVRVRWSQEMGGTRLVLAPVRKDWLGEQEATQRLSTAQLGALLRKAVAEDAFSEETVLFLGRS